MILATWEIQNGAYQKGIFKYKNDITKFTIATQTLTNLLTIIFFVIAFSFWPITENLTKMPREVFVLLMLYMIVQPAYTCWLIRKRTSYQYQPAVVVTIIYTLANVIVPMLAIIKINNTAVIKYEATLISSIVICGIFYFRNFNCRLIVKEWKIIKKQWIFLIRFEAPLVLHSLSYLILNQADRIMIGAMVGNSQAAYYSVAYSLASVVNIFQNSINQALLPWRYEMLEKKQYKKISDVTTYLLLGMAGIVLLVILIVPEVMKLLFTRNYYEAVWSIPPITLGVYFMFLYTIFVNIESYFEKTQYIMYVSVSCGIINIVLNYICIKLFGYIACGYTTLISYILFACGHYYFMNKILQKEIQGIQVVNKNSILIISIMVIVVSLFVTIIYPYMLVRYGVVCVLIICVLKNKNRISKFVRSLKM